MEPVYTYVRGQGWVPQASQSVEFTFRCGTRVRAERRPPEPGEYYTAGWADSWCDAPGVHKLKPEWWSESIFRNQLIADTNTIVYYNRLGEEAFYETGWITFVPLGVE